ncbi:glycosyltransferase [Albimonas sp. CAU 1670]|uniref:glycosyltransferase family 2 protein n=1 Tax=Albimonas sp. CAU 1670 TaxID=3032599 RepID=UPI0023DC3908|nr:glycosyltransferase [Albimonas sp. CAU 1670]MDF2234797.1 glycosyltransferase [Albimonas sp. CAU 1670]
MDALRLSEVQSAWVQVALVIGAGLLAAEFADRRRTAHRMVIFAISGVLAIRYGWWRATETLAPFGLTWDCLASWTFFAIEAGAILSSLSAFAILSRTKARHAESTRHAGWWGQGPAPRVAILIATYNESREVLERTIVGAKALRHPAKEILVLDDGRREWLGEFCRELGVRHVTRPDNSHAKAGNINHGLALLRAEGPPDYVAVLDADFVPHQGFLSRTLALFHEPDVGLVQTPQHFFNPDPIQHNLGLSRSYPDEQRFFFDHLQPARDAWGIAFCCGTSSIARWEALDAIGGFPTGSITEDFLVTLTMQDAGWRTVYLDEPLTEGLAPEGLKEYVTQRARWCLGLMQIARGNLGPLSRNRLRWVDRWSVIDSVLYWTTTYTFRLAALSFPLLYWFFGITVVDARVPDVISYFGVYFVWVLLALNVVSRGLVVPLVNDVSQMLGAIPIARAAFTGLIQPHGHPFKVTAKGGDRDKVVVQWALMRPFLVLLGLTLLGLTIGIASPRFAFGEAGDGKTVILFWTVYNVLVLALTLLVCIELPRAERHVADGPERAALEIDGVQERVWLAELTSEGARVRGRQPAPGTAAVLHVPDVGPVAAMVRATSGDGVRLRLDPTPEQREALLRRFYTTGEAPGATRTRLMGLAGDFGSRLLGLRR